MLIVTRGRLADLLGSRRVFFIGNWSFRLVAPLALLGLLTSVLFVGGSLLARQRSAG